jgi:hypothetical protein
MQKFAKLIGVVAVLFGSMAANATSIFWDFSYTGAGVSANGVLTTDSVLNGGAYLITDISGQRNGETILSLVPAGTFGNLFSDNLLFPNAPFLDNSGVTYLTASGAYNFCYAGSDCGSSGYQDITNQTVIFTPVQLSITKVPESGMLALFSIGLLVGGIATRKKIAKQ